MSCPMSGSGFAAPVSVAAAAFARELVAAACPLTAARAKALVFAASRLAAFAQQTGLQLDREIVLCEATIERFVLQGCACFSPATRRTLRSTLRSLARALERYPQPPPLGLGRERAKTPYSPAHIEGYLRLGGAAAPGAGAAAGGGPRGRARGRGARHRVGPRGAAGAGPGPLPRAAAGRRGVRGRAADHRRARA